MHKDVVMERDITKANIEYSIDILIQYKKGETNLNDASAIFSELTGVELNTAKKYISAMKRENVIEFIVLNAFFPNSIYYCLNKVAVHVDRLNKFNQINPINNLSFCIDKLERNMRYTNIKDIQTIGLEPYLDNLKSEVYALNNEVNRIYFNF